MQRDFSFFILSSFMPKNEDALARITFLYQAATFVTSQGQALDTSIDNHPVLTNKETLATYPDDLKWLTELGGLYQKQMNLVCQKSLQRM